MKLLKQTINILNILVLILLFLYLLNLTASVTTMELPTPDGYSDWLLLVLKILTVCCMAFKLVRAKIEHNRRLIFSIFTALLFAALLFAIYQKNHNSFIVFLGLFLLALVDFDNHKIIFTYLIATGSIVFLAICSSLGGFITDYTYIKDFHVRGSLGVVYPTDLASVVLYLLIGSWIVFGDRITDLFFAFLALLSALFSYFVAYSTTSFICSLALCAFCILHEAIGDWNLSGKKEKIVTIFIMLSYPLFGGLMFFWVWLNQHGVNLVNTIPSLSSRLNLSISAIETYGVTLFGSSMSQIGAGGSTYISYTDYNFVDNSYVLMLLGDGLIFFLAISVLWEISLWRAMKNGDRRMALSMVIIALHSFSEHHFPELNYNILLIITFTQFRTEKVSYWKTDLNRLGKALQRHIPSIGVLICLLFLSPTLASWSRVIGENYGLTGGGNVQYLVCLIILIFAGIILGLMYSLDQLWRNIRNHDKNTGPLILTSVFSALVLVGLYGSNKEVSHIATDHAEQFTAEESVITLIKNNAEYPVYADTDAALYQRLYGGFHYSLWNNEELSRYRNSTVILDIDNDSTLFSDRGFLYTQISDQHVLYTTDSAVISALQEAGYHLTAYNAEVHEEDLASLAESNGLTLDNSGIVLKGKEASLIYGSYTNLRPGRYTITYSLQLNSMEVTDDTTVCTLFVHTKYGVNTVASQSVSYDEFDENGQANIVVTIEDNSNSFLNTEFQVSAEDGVTLHVTGISWQMTPYTDVHKTYDNNWNCIQEVYYDLDGNLLVTDQGYTIQKHQYNDKNQLIETTYCDENGAPVVISSGYASVRWERDQEDRITSESYYDIDGKPIALSSGQASDSRSYDDAGNLVDQKFYDIDGDPVMISAGYAEIRKEYDDQKHYIREEYYDENGNLMMLNGEYAILEREYDSNGNQVSESYYDTSGNPVLRSSGYARIQWTYNEKNQRVTERYYGVSGEAIALASGQASDSRGYDDAGNLVDQKFYDVDGNPVRISAGYAEIRKEYDDQKHCIREEYYDENGNLMLLNGEYAILEREYDSNGNQVSESYFDTSGNPVLRSSGYAEKRWTYNENNQRVTESYYDASGNPIALASGQASDSRSYDDAGNLVDQKFYDVDGNPVRITAGYAEIRKEYDDQKRCIREEYYDENGNLMLLNGEYAILEHAYDENGNDISHIYYDTKGQRVIRAAGFAELRWTYNDKNQVVTESYYDLNGEPVTISSGQASDSRSYDEAGNLIDQKFYDVSGNLVRISAGYAEVRKEYDSENRCIREEYYDEEGNFVNLPAGYAVLMRTYDADGNVVSQTYEDASGNPVEIS